MTYLDNLLNELESLDKARTPGEWHDRVGRVFSQLWVLIPTKALEMPQSEVDDNAAFITKAVNINALLREVIRVQRRMLNKMREGCLDPGNSGIPHIHECTLECEQARQALAETEKLVRDAGEKT